jgi:hypothetical protein
MNASHSITTKSIRQPIKSHVVAIALALATVAVTIPSFAANPANKPAAKTDDPMLHAMQLELDREQALLVLPGMSRPYFMEYRLDDFTIYEAVANYGALTNEVANHQRVVRVTVRIGDYTVDSSTSRGDGVVQLAPLDNDPEALRYALWVASDEAYKNALRAYTAKQAELRRFQSAPGQPDFAKATPVTYLGPLVSLDLDRNEWKKRIIQASGLYISDPEARAYAAGVQYSTANVRAIALNRYVVNTEGTTLRHGYTGYTAAISLGGQAPDGMRLGRDNGSTAANARELDTWPVFRQRVLDDLKSLYDLRKAPVVDADDYHGPVLFSGDAAADVFNRLFVPNVEADRPDMGTTARTQGGYSSSLRAQVLPPILNVTDDPALDTFHGRHLLGSYAYDDEGVPAQSVDVVVNGKLQNFLIGREPIRDFPSSNGHGRAAPGQAAASHAGIVVFKSNQPLTPAAMNDRLLALAKEQGRDVYAVETLVGELSPRLLYRVHPDGSRQLVRGAVFDELDNRSLRSEILAAGDSASSFVSSSISPIPTTTIAPSLLFGDIEVKRATEEQQKLPYYPPPAIEAK